MKVWTQKKFANNIPQTDFKPTKFSPFPQPTDPRSIWAEPAKAMEGSREAKLERISEARRRVSHQI